MALDCAHNTTGPEFIATQEFLVTYCITFVYFLLCIVPFRVQLVDTLCKIFCFDIFTGIFMKVFCIWNIILGLYRVVRECGHSQAPKPKLHKESTHMFQEENFSLNPPQGCKAQPRCASLGYLFRNTAAHMEATPTREGI